jgi:hypothetical protein
VVGSTILIAFCTLRSAMLSSPYLFVNVIPRIY